MLKTILITVLSGFCWFSFPCFSGPILFLFFSFILLFSHLFYVPFIFQDFLILSILFKIWNFQFWTFKSGPSNYDDQTAYIASMLSSTQHFIELHHLPPPALYCRNFSTQPLRPQIRFPDGTLVPAAAAPAVPADAWWMTSPLGTPRGRYDEYSSSFSLS
jgi:hypothetical protein